MMARTRRRTITMMAMVMLPDMLAVVGGLVERYVVGGSQKLGFGWMMI